jgi:anti-sigma regulatory factor (Ser/Thr protein kinase)
MVELANVRLNLTNTAENVVVVRAVLSGIAEGYGIPADQLGDIRTAVTEACNNVVLHAYEGEPGPMDVEIAFAADALSATVRDRGVGIGEHAHEDGIRLGIGLHVIRTLANDADFDEPPGGGTRVRMQLAAGGARPLQPGLTVGPETDLPGAIADLPAAISIAPVRLARAVVPRLVCTLAARAHFSTDRLSDLQLLCDTLAAHADTAVSEPRLTVGVRILPRELELMLAPLRLGHGRGLIGASSLDGLGTVIERLADRHQVLDAGERELLAVGVRDRRPR